MIVYLTSIAQKRLNDEYFNKLSNRAKEKYLKLQRIAPNKALQTATADLLLQKALKLTAPPKISENEFGAPFIIGASEFSISHSENLTAVAVDDCAVGLDVQVLNDDIAQKTAKAVLNGAEILNFNNLQTVEEQTKYFFRCLTEKESYVKFLKIGFQSMPRDIADYGTAKFLTKYVFQSNEVYCLTLCSQNFKSVKYQVVPFEDL